MNRTSSMPRWGKIMMFLSSLRWRKSKSKIWLLCGPTWTSKIIEWMFPLWVCFWDQYSLSFSVKLEKLVTFMCYLYVWQGNKTIIIIPSIAKTKAENLPNYRSQFFLLPKPNKKSIAVNPNIKVEKAIWNVYLGLAVF